jgi:hypothetical protein
MIRTASWSWLMHPAYGDTLVVTTGAVSSVDVPVTGPGASLLVPTTGPVASVDVPVTGPGASVLVPTTGPVAWVEDPVTGPVAVVISTGESVVVGVGATLESNRVWIIIVFKG